MTVIALQAAGKSYSHYDHTLDRLREVVTGRPRHHERVALHPLTLHIDEREVVGLIGLNGAGKSTFLKLVAGTIVPSSGQITVNGQISALLELGNGFHPDMSGRDNVYLSGSVMGLPNSEIDRLYPEIVAFAGLDDVMEQPIKTYSSGMMIRLAFAVATSVEPSILIVDEALSVGDALFARKSFDRIMSFKKAGRTILFCSHSLYQVEAICSRVIWLHRGAIRLDGPPADVITAYNEFLGTPGGTQDEGALTVVKGAGDAASPDPVPILGSVSGARFVSVSVSAAGDTGRKVVVQSGITDVRVCVKFASDPALPAPGIGVLVNGPDGRTIASAGSGQDGFQVQRSADGSGHACVTFPKFALLKGNYWINAYLLSEDRIHVYDKAELVAEVTVRQEGLEQGIVSLPRVWSHHPTPAESESARP